MSDGRQRLFVVVYVGQCLSMWGCTHQDPASEKQDGGQNAMVTAAATNSGSPCLAIPTRLAYPPALPDGDVGTWQPQTINVGDGNLYLSYSYGVGGFETGSILRIPLNGAPPSTFAPDYAVLVTPSSVFLSEPWPGADGSLAIVRVPPSGGTPVLGR
jgi:hypothetical protein